ncbi:MAG: hypothetical protein Q7T86_03125 [Hyphomicrobiaceae bacterium]|nr:hypothetical protein [Hyphomicrobiaceae bacterium]
MPSSANVKIIRISAGWLPGMWPLVEPWLSKGLTAATDLSMVSIHHDLKTGEADLWAIAAPGEVRGAFLTSLYEHESGGVFLGVYALGGEHLPEWSSAINDTMQKFAKSQGAKSVRFAGREAWSRVLPDYRVIGQRLGHQVYERAL